MVRSCWGSGGGACGELFEGDAGAGGGAGIEGYSDRGFRKGKHGSNLIRRFRWSGCAGVCVGEGFVGFDYAVGEIDGAGGVFDDDGFEAEVFAVDGGVADAEVVGEAAEEEALRLRSRR